MTDTIEAPKQIELLTFKLSDQEYSLDIMCVREIRGWTQATPLPHSPSYMKGVINLRGTVLPVMDLAQRLGLSVSEHSDRSVIIVVKHEDTLAGLLVDAVSDIIALNDDDMLPPPDAAHGATPGIVKSLTLIEDRMIRLLDLSQLVTTLQSDAA